MFQTGSSEQAMKALLMLITTLLAFAGPPASAQQYANAVSEDRRQDPAFSVSELDQMLAPIALYPDALLSQVLMASTYPLEVVEAARWSRSNPDLTGERAVEAVTEMDWDASVKGLVAFPDVLAKMDEDLDWTRRLGDAFLYQEDDVMDRVQFLRDRAYEAGNLESNEYARVVREERITYIEPVRERIVYVPYYDPWVAYGSWWDPMYPPAYWAPPPFYYLSHSGFFWSYGIGLSPGFFYSTMYWPRRHVVILHRPRYCGREDRWRHRDDYTAGERWNHDPWHRRGVDYRHRDLRERYARSSASGVVPMAATRDVIRRPRSAEGSKRTAPSAEPVRSTQPVRSTLTREAQPVAMAPDRRTQQPARFSRPQAAPDNRPVRVAQAPRVQESHPRTVPDSGPRHVPAARGDRRQREAAADDRGQRDTNPSVYRGPDATLMRPR
jgi:hypothetical protein